MTLTGPTSPSLGAGIGVDALQRIATRGWPGFEQVRLGDWVMRAGEGWTARANSVLALGDPGMPLEAALDRVVGFYLARGLTPRLQVHFPVPGLPVDGTADVPAPGLDTDLAARGWIGDPPTVVLTGALDDLNLSGSGRDVTACWADRDVTASWAPEPDATWLSIYHYRGTPLPEASVRVVTAVPATYLTLRARAAVVGVGRLVHTDDWIGLTAIEVIPERRGQGWGRTTTLALLRRGVELGARHVYLQVLGHNEPAMRLYRSLGMTPHHRYRYRTTVPV